MRKRKQSKGDKSYWRVSKMTAFDKAWSVVKAVCPECGEDRPSYDYSHGQKMCDFCYESDYHQGTRNVK